MSGPRLVDHLGDANAVVRKDPLAADRLDLMMEPMGTTMPSAPPRPADPIGQQQVFPGQTPEAIDEEAATLASSSGLTRAAEH